MPTLHKPTKSGLWSHSHDPENDLMKHYLVKTPTNLIIQSFDTLEECALFIYNYLVGTHSGWSYAGYLNWCIDNKEHPALGYQVLDNFLTTEITLSNGYTTYGSPVVMEV
jgi:hypothetical protein